MVEIANVVGSGDLGIEVDLSAVETDLPVPYAEYDPDKYHGLYVRLTDGGPLITLYRSGKYIISGCSAVEEVYETNREFLQTLATLGRTEPSVETGFTVQNIVSIGTLEQAVNLNAVAVGLGLKAVEYEPEQFPGLVYRPGNFPTVLLVFASGKVVITGAARVETAENAFTHLQDQINWIRADSS